VAEFIGHTRAVNHALVHARSIYTASDDGTVREWRNLDLTEVFVCVCVCTRVRIDLRPMSQREQLLLSANVKSMPSFAANLSSSGEKVRAVLLVCVCVMPPGFVQHKSATVPRKITVLREKIATLDLSGKQLSKIVLVPKDAAKMDLTEVCKKERGGGGGKGCVCVCAHVFVCDL
jgi:hypothetical protein